MAIISLWQKVKTNPIQVKKWIQTYQIQPGEVLQLDAFGTDQLVATKLENFKAAKLFWIKTSNFYYLIAC